MSGRWRRKTSSISWTRGAATPGGWAGSSAQWTSAPNIVAMVMYPHQMRAHGM